MIELTKAQQDRQLCIERYGKVCACCGEDRDRFLCLSYLFPGAFDLQRSILGEGEKSRNCGAGAVVYRYAVKNHFPPLFRVLCANCNHAIKTYGTCPHELERIASMYNTVEEGVAP